MPFEPIERSTIDRAVTAAGGIQPLATLLGVHRDSLYAWRNGGHVARQHAARIRGLAAGTLAARVIWVNPNGQVA